jgi:hypothetical protein
MDRVRTGACFYTEFDKGERSIEELAALAKVENPDPSRFNENNLVGGWGGFGCELLTEKLTFLQLFEIRFDNGDFYDLRRPKKGIPHLPLEEDPALPLVLAFRDTCLALEQTAAFITITDFSSDEEWVRSLDTELDIFTGTALNLAGYRFSLLYLNAELAEEYKKIPSGHPFVQDRDQLPVEGGGLLLFSGTGWDRW